MAYWYNPMEKRSWRSRRPAAYEARVRHPEDQPRTPVKLIVVVGFGPPGVTWRPLSTLRGCAVDEAGGAGELLVRVRTWDAPLDHEIRSMSPEQLEREVRELVARVLAGVRVVEVERR